MQRVCEPPGSSARAVLQRVEEHVDVGEVPQREHADHSPSWVTAIASALEDRRARTLPLVGDASWVSVTTNGPHVVVAGEIDHTSSRALADGLAARTGDVTLDLSGVTFMDSSGLRVLLKAARSAEAAGHTLSLVAVSAPVARLLRITGLSDALRIPDGHPVSDLG
jgi:anti-sigma B factor antagonist